MQKDALFNKNFYEKFVFLKNAKFVLLKISC